MLTDQLGRERTRADQAEVRAGAAEAAARIAQDKAEADLRDARAAAMRAELAHATTAERLTQVEAIAQKAEHDRAAAVAIADEAVRAAEALRQAEAARAGATTARLGWLAGEMTVRGRVFCCPHSRRSGPRR